MRLFEGKYNLMQTEQFVVIAKLGVEYLGEDEVNYQWYGDKGSHWIMIRQPTYTLVYKCHPDPYPSWKLLYGVKTTIAGR